MVNRNAPCPCGSGKRFKHCCGRDADSAITTPARYQALTAQRAGRLGEAEALYRRALEEDASDVDSLHMLGIVEFERMRYREALALLWEAESARSGPCRRSGTTWGSCSGSF